MVDKPPVLEFPTDYPIKVIGRPTAEFRARIHAIVLSHVPALEASHVTEHLSKNGNYLSISYALRAESRERAHCAAELQGGHAAAQLRDAHAVALDGRRGAGRKPRGLPPSLRTARLR